MLDLLRERSWRFVCSTFPERQIYIRSDGRVQFFTFGPHMQAIMAGISLVFLGWVAFTSVNTVFKDRIIASKENHFRQLQESYETRIANLQLSYDQLNGALVAAEDQFRVVAEELEAKQQALASVIRNKEAVRAALGLGRPSGPAGAPVSGQRDAGPLNNGPADSTVLADQGIGSLLPRSAAALAPAIGTIKSGSRVTPVTSSTTTNKSTEGRPRAYLRDAAQKFGQFFHVTPGTVFVNHPSLPAIAGLRDRLAALIPSQKALLEAATVDVKADAKRLERAIRDAGLNPSKLLARLNRTHGVGGPNIPLTSGYGDEDFANAAAGAAAELGALQNVATAMTSVPLTSPVPGRALETTSGFGARKDPFTNRLAFHSGLDFAGAWGTPVSVTAPGIVTYAGPRGEYGNTVEVDHGFGIKTRYGHLSRVSVAVGTKVVRGAQIGKIGSTGRSTGPHLHYEVWVENAVRNPSKFLKAGRDVLKD